MVEQFADWDKWKNTLKTAVNLGEKIGFEEETVIKIGAKIGDLLNWNADPESREQRVLKELWDAADEEEQKVLTKIIIKMVKEQEVLAEK